MIFYIAIGDSTWTNIISVEFEVIDSAGAAKVASKLAASRRGRGGSRPWPVRPGDRRPTGTGTGKLASC